MFAVIILVSFDGQGTGSAAGNVSLEIIQDELLIVVQVTHNGRLDHD
jgi:hypothetical protein